MKADPIVHCTSYCIIEFTLLFYTLSRSYYKGVAAAIIVYDVTQRITFDEVESWLEDCLIQCEPNTTMILLANKCDIEGKRIVSTEVSHVKLIIHLGCLCYIFKGLDCTYIGKM